MQSERLLRPRHEPSPVHALVEAQREEEGCMGQLEGSTELQLSWPAEDLPHPPYDDSPDAVRPGEAHLGSDIWSGRGRWEGGRLGCHHL